MNSSSSPSNVIIRWAVICLLMSTVGETANAAEGDLFRLGLTGSATLNMHRGTLDTYDGLLECGSFSDANTLSWMAGNTFWFPVTPSFALNARIQYWKADGTFTSPNDVQPNVSLPDGSLVTMKSTYELNTTLDYIDLDLIAMWYPVENFFIGIGPQIGFNTRASFEQKETIDEPAFLEFTQGGRERTFLAASFEQNGVTAGLRFAAQAVVGYDFRVHPHIIITPEVGFAYGITNVLSSSDWKVHAPRAGVSLYWAFTPDPEPRVEYISEPTPPTTPVAATPAAAPSLMMKANVSSVMSDGSRLPGADVVITENRSSDVVPLLPFVFFDSASSVIPARYARVQASSFNEERLRDSILGIYHHLLNIVGERMTRYADASLSVRGFREPASGENDQALADARAAVVKQFLVERWNIAPSRISTSSGVLPSIVSNQSLDDGRAENRRTELSSSDPRILAPVTLNLVEYATEPASIDIETSYGDVRPGSATAEIRIGSSRVAGPLPVSSSTASWQVDPRPIAEAMGTSTVATGTVEVKATFNDGTEMADGAVVTARRVVRSSRFSNEVVNDSIIERFRLIFFDYDKPTVSDFNKRTIDLIRSRIRTNSSMQVTGLTDRIGPKEHNTALSLRRAEAIDKTIKERIVPERSTVSGAGPLEIYNNDLPEGRWYNRTVLIEVATPVEYP